LVVEKSLGTSVWQVPKLFLLKVTLISTKPLAWCSGAELGGCQGGPLPLENFAWSPQWPPQKFSGLFLKVLQRRLAAPLVAKLAPPVAPPNENVWLRPPAGVPDSFC